MSTPVLAAPAARLQREAVSTPSDPEGIDQAARAFEKLLVHRLLKDMRSASLGEKASNASATWNDLFDEKIAGIISEGPGIGLRKAIARSLSGTAVPRTEPSEAARTDPRSRTDSSTAPGLNVQELQRLRSLLPGAADEVRPAAAALRSGGIAFETMSATATGGTIEQRFLAPLLSHARRNATRLGTSADAVLAIAALESGWGQHPIRDSKGEDAHNLFGIKSVHANEPAVAHRTTEFVAGETQSVVAHFRQYASAGASVDGFADFVLGNPRYAPALASAKDPESFIRALHAAGYATDPAYAEKAIAVMQRVRTHLGALQ